MRYAHLALWGGGASGATGSGFLNGWTSTGTRDTVVLGSVEKQLLAGEAVADTRPLQAMIARHVDEKLLRRVAEAHRNGRRLYIGTSDLDLPHFVVCNMGLIANSGRPDALELFRKVMLAGLRPPRSRWPFRRCCSK